MNYFKELDNLPVYDLYEEFQKMFNDGKLHWYKTPSGETINDQICLNSMKGKENDIHYGRGSLRFEWDKSYYTEEGKLITPLREQKLKETDFTELCTQFKGTLFEEVYRALTSQYNIGRIRIMNSKPKTCLTWHQDNTKRIHYPMKTQVGCLMVVENEVKHLEKNTWYLTETKHTWHTAFNSSKEERLHLVATTW